MNNDHAQWLIGMVVTVLISLIGGIAVLIRAAVSAGRREAKLDTAIEKLTKIDQSLDKIPNHEVRIGQLEEMFHGLRSDIKHLLRGSSSWGQEE